MTFSPRRRSAAVRRRRVPDTILGWYRKLVARKFEKSKARREIGRPQLEDDIEQLITRMAKANLSLGYDRIAGAYA